MFNRPIAVALYSVIFLGNIPSAWSALMVSDLSALHVNFSALLPPFTTWRNRNEAVNISFSMGSTTLAPLEVSAQLDPKCPPDAPNKNSACMMNTQDHSQIIHYLIQYIPCGNMKSFYLSNSQSPKKMIILDAQYTNWNQCKTSPGIMRFTRLSLFSKPLPASGIYRANMTLEIREL